MKTSSTGWGMLSGVATKNNKPQKSQIRLAQDDTKTPLHDPVLRSDPVETEEAVLRLPPLPNALSISKQQSR